MPRAKSPPRVKGPYSERDGTRFRIRVCAIAGHRDLYFSTRKDALAGMNEAVGEFSQSGNSRALSSILDEYMEDKVKHGSCTARSANCQRAHLRKWLADYLARDIDKLTPKHSAVHRVCRAAGVPIVCPHSLRGLWATAGVRSGALSHAVAAALGHGSFAVTAKHYVRPGAPDGARTERLVQLLALETAKPAVEPEALSTQQLLASLPYETLARLVALAEQTSGRNA